MVIKGQNFRVRLNDLYIAAATSCQLHIAANLEDSSTKDDTDAWQKQEVIGKSWDGSAEGLVFIDTTDTTGLQAFDATELVGQTVTIEYTTTQGTKNREATTAVKYTGSAIVNDLSLTAQNRQNATYTIQFQGTGALTRQMPAETNEGEQ